MNKIEIIKEEQNNIAKEINRRKEFSGNLDVLSGGDVVDFNYLSEIEVLKGQINILEIIKNKFASEVLDDGN